MFRLIREEAKVRNLRNVIFGLGCLIGGGFLANYFGAEVGAQQHTVERIWKAEDCKKISDGSGAFLYISGLLFEEGDKLKKDCSGHDVYIFSGNPELSKNIGLRTKKRIIFL